MYCNAIQSEPEALKMRNMKLLLAAVLIVLAGCGRKATPDFEKQFEQMMTRAVLVGHSTLDARTDYREKNAIPSTV